jgi:hypothetical protein
VPGSRDADPHALAESNARFANEVLPTLRGYEGMRPRAFPFESVL